MVARVVVAISEPRSVKGIALAIAGDWTSVVATLESVIVAVLPAMTVARVTVVAVKVLIANGMSLCEEAGRSVCPAVVQSGAGGVATKLTMGVGNP